MAAILESCYNDVVFVVLRRCTWRKLRQHAMALSELHLPSCYL